MFITIICYCYCYYYFRQVWLRSDGDGTMNVRRPGGEASVVRAKTGMAMSSAVHSLQQVEIVQVDAMQVCERSIFSDLFSDCNTFP